MTDTSPTDDTPRNGGLPSPPEIRPYQAAVEGWTARDITDTNDPADWPNSVSVTATTGWVATVLDTPSGDNREGYADAYDERQLVEVDTNYKPTRTSEHPVRLTRTGALELVAHLLAATEDTFHNARVGRLRATEAAKVLDALNQVEYAVQQLREHALIDLLVDTGIE